MIEVFTVYAYTPADDSPSDLGIEVAFSETMANLYTDEELQKILITITETILKGYKLVEINGPAVQVSNDQ